MMLQQNMQLASGAVILPWLVYCINRFLPFDLRLYGLRPRHLDGLWGLVCSPFLHMNLGHLIANTGALFVLLTVALSFSRKLTFIAIVIIAILGGGLVWVFGKGHTIHIGASGIIFGLIGFLMFIGVFRREWSALAVSAAIFFLYGGALLSLFYALPGISWEGHFFGFLSGVLAAWWTKSAKSKS
ncbi:MAG: rhomboid family intramembrane serine protease [Desulfobacterales bacterium]|nr:MAG: rhomboid family intramembrane serine protease [Desulfobacterales bacterium]